MKTIILNGNPRVNGNTAAVVEAFGIGRVREHREEPMMPAATDAKNAEVAK